MSATNSQTTQRFRSQRVPAYRQRSGYDQALVTLTDAVTKRRRDSWLGEFDSPESCERYHRLIAEWERLNRRLPAPDYDGAATARHAGITVIEVIHAYWQWAEGYYRPKHAQALRGVLELLSHDYGRTPAL